MTYTRNFTLPRYSDETGLTILATLSDDGGSTPYKPGGATTYVDQSLTVTELPCYHSNGVDVTQIKYNVLAVVIPDGFDGHVILHVGAVGAGADFSGVDVLDSQAVGTSATGETNITTETTLITSD